MKKLFNLNTCTAAFIDRRLLSMLCLIFLGIGSLFSQPTLCFEIENERTVTHPTLGNSYAFDVAMHASDSGTYHSKGLLYLAYDTTKFGSSADLKNNIAVEHQSLLQGSYVFLGMSTPKYTTVNVIDHQDSVVEITWQANFSSFLPSPFVHNEVPDTLTKLYTIYLKIVNPPSSGDVNVLSPLMANQQFFLTDVNGIANEVPYSNCTHKPVFPGDANFNQVCNYTDLLYLGIAFGDTGAVRPNASLSWAPQYGPNWADTLPNGRNMKHADCDGDGAVGFADTVAINQNYGMTHTFSRGGRASGNVPLFVTTATPVFFPGDTVTFEIHLGTMDSVADDIYGIGFAVGYDTSQVEPEMIWADYSGSWLGSKNQDMITVHKDFFAHGRVDMALTRINHMDRNGHGKIADLIIVIDDDLYKRSMPFELMITESFAWDANGEEVELQPRDSQFNIEDPNTSISSILENQLSIFPIPAQSQLSIHHTATRLKTVQLYDLQGKLQATILELNDSHSQLTWTNLPAGFYLLKMGFDEGKLVKKIIIK